MRSLDTTYPLSGSISWRLAPFMSMKLGGVYEAVYTPLKHTAGITSLKTDNAWEDFLRWTEGAILFACCSQREYIEMRCLQPGKVLVTAGLCSV